MSEQTIIDRLVSSWVSLGLEATRGAPGVTGLYIYLTAEFVDGAGSIGPFVLVEQHGRIEYLGGPRGVDVPVDKVLRLYGIMSDEVQAANAEFAALGVPAPTEYRIFYDTVTGAVDVRLSRELLYAFDEAKGLEWGVIDWLGDRAPRIV